MALVRLSAEESLRLVAGVRVGRLVFDLRDRPQIRPVNFVLDGGRVILRTDAGAKLTAAVRHAIVAFVCDEIDPLAHTGWSVTLTGRMHEISDPAERQRLGALLRPRADGDGEHFLGIVPETIQGMRLG
jgi:nitroimidazol reductase NimA-like FMN-containing flavoprotein (pyridoxamine 5'-phosphate oxidase superfamily)